MRSASGFRSQFDWFPEVRHFAAAVADPSTPRRRRFIRLVDMQSQIGKDMYADPIAGLDGEPMELSAKLSPLQDLWSQSWSRLITPSRRMSCESTAMWLIPSSNTMDHSLPKSPWGHCVLSDSHLAKKVSTDPVPSDFFKTRASRETFAGE